MQVEDAGVHELALKCPTCGRPKGVACIRLGTVPGNRIMWVQTDPHPARAVARRG